MALHSDKEIFKELIALAADHFGYEQSHIEKDYWVCKILKEIALSEYKEKVFFKGGTSLSKAYGLIERFSEDLDLFVFTGNTAASKQAEKTLNKKLSKFIIEQNAGIYREELSETGGNFRKLLFSYENVFKGVGLKENLEVEIKSCDLSDKKQYELDGFKIQCINPRKTICDKISRLVKLSYNEDAVNLLAKHIRDIYDLCQLFHTSEYNQYLQSEEFLEAMYRVTVEDGLNKNSKSHLSLADAPIFKSAKEMMAKPEIMVAYTSDLKKLAFDKQKMPSIEKAISTVESIHGRLIKFEIFRKNKI